ncbi:extracellular solute-binding protein [Bacillus sp. GX]|uniref:extracellular solute-binding protein n=1 Tax=Bacillus TaxID=1386 RepID=UPI00065B6A95|nr:MULTISPECIES: extracellular solute-binding protein [Bacillus]KMP36522.1 ABC transporter substrate-binding protein [Bacillus cereus]MBU5217610.1 extracellular solute-binding protein [Bacillus albus]MDC6157119.1 extracellular solute-binding protein [Bacillus albus]MDD8006596.1 extracellular solute-binding protein [Bacillus albus]RXJ16705.1 extracellular solute-binding protein [Bacillus albus]
MKKLFMLLTVVTLFISTLSGCSGGKGSTVKASKEGEKIVVPFINGVGGSLADHVDKIVEEYNKSQDKYVVKTTKAGNYDESYQKLQSGFAANNQEAIALLGSDVIQEYVKKQLIVPLDESVKNDDDFKKEDYGKGFMEQATIDGKLYGIPFYGTTQIFYYNKEALAENGFTKDDLKTWEGVEKVAKTVAKRGENGNVSYAGWMPMWGTSNLIDAVRSAGGNVLSEDGKKVLINDDTWVTVWEKFRTWLHEDKIMKIHSGGTGWEYWDKTVIDLVEGRTLGFTGSSGDQGFVFKSLGKGMTEEERLSTFDALPQPAWGNHKPAPKLETYLFTLTRNIDPEVAKGAYAFMKFATSTEKTAEWSMATGYIPVRNNVTEYGPYAEFVKKQPQALVPLEQANNNGVGPFVDPTGGKINDALNVAKDKVEIEGVSAKKALDEAAKVAQEELDKVLKKKK